MHAAAVGCMFQVAGTDTAVIEQTSGELTSFTFVFTLAITCYDIPDVIVCKHGYQWRR